MKTKLRQALLAALLCAALTINVHAQTPLITYQGRLTNGGNPANGLYDLSFELFDDALAGSSWAAATNTAVLVSNGLFTVQIEVDPGVFDGTDLWLEIGATTNGGGSFTTLSPRQPITSAPYAIKAASAMTMDMGFIYDPAFIGTTTIDPLDLFVNNTRGLRLEYPSSGTTPNLIGGYSGNTISSSAEGSVIAGGGKAGVAISIGNSSDLCFIGGGRINTIGDNSEQSVVSGGNGNHLGDNTDYAVIAGGSGNNIGGDSYSSTIAGGNNNNIAFNAWYAAITGGYNNNISTNSDSSVIGGGASNTIGENTFEGTISGGFLNSIGASSSGSTIGGGWQNTIASLTSHAVIPGGLDNAIGPDAYYAFAAGHRAKANHRGSFVWADSQNADFTSTANNQFNVRASGGVRIETSGTGQVGIGTATPEGDVHIQGTSATGSLIVAPNSANGQSQLLLAENTSASYGMIIRYAGGDTDNPLHFIGWNGDVEGSPLMTIERTGGGNVGIGISNPTEKLHVMGGVNATTFIGDGAGLTGLNADELTSGTLPGFRLSGLYPNAVIFNNTSNSFAGSGADLDFLNASQLTAGTVPGARLAGTYSAKVSFTDIGNEFFGIFTGDAGDTAGAPSFTWNGDSNTGMFRSGADELALTTAGTERFNITAQGNVSIGIPGGSNDGSLHVQNTSGAGRPIKCDRVGSDGELLAWARDDGVVGSVTVAGGVVSYNAFTGSHYTWCEEEPEPGMLMVLTGQNRPLHPDSPSEVVYGVEPCSRENDPACLGAYVSTTPMGEAAQDRPIRLVAAVGNGELWIVDTGRDIRPGDLLIASATPGCARLDDPSEFSVSHVIARAAEAVDWSEVQADSDGIKRKKISILFGAFVRENRGAPERVAHLEARVAELEALVSKLSGNNTQMLAENGTRTGDER